MRNLANIQGKAVLFDMDGTLVDSTQVVVRAWEWWSARHGLSLEDVLSFSHGRPTIDTLEHFLPGRDHTEESIEHSIFSETQTEGICAVPGVADILLALTEQSHPWAVVTSAWRKLAEIRLIAAGLPLPDVIIPIDEIGNGKPDPEGFLRAAELLGVRPEDCIVFEDTRPGIDAGVSAGMQVIGILTTYTARELRHQPVIRDFRDVLLRSEEAFLTLEVSDRYGSP